jgi:hypothetical protein
MTPLPNDQDQNLLYTLVLFFTALASFFLTTSLDDVGLRSTQKEKDGAGEI